MANLQETLVDIAKAIVDSPDEVRVKVEENETSISFYLSVAPSDVGLVIGKHGKIANAIRTVMKAAAVNSGKRVYVEIK